MATFTITQTPDDINLYLYPTSNKNAAFTASAANNYQCVDDTWFSPNDDTDYVYTKSTSVVTDIYVMGDHSSEIGTINYVKVIVVARSVTEAQSSTGAFKIIINDSTTSSYSDNQVPLTTSYRKYYYIMSTKPSGGAWSWTDVDNLNIGFNASSPSVTKAIKDVISHPNGPGNSITGTNHGASTNWECVDDPSDYTAHDGATTYIDNSDYSSSHFSIACEKLYLDSNYTINSVTEHLVVYVPTSIIHHCEYYIRTHGTDYNVESGGHISPPDTWVHMSNAWTTNPNTAAAWTSAEIDALEIGWGGYAVNQKCTQAYATVNYQWLNKSPYIRITQCYAVVNYAPPTSTVTLNFPSEINVSHSRKITRHLFPNGEYEVDDYGRNGKTLSISGMEYATTYATTMNTLKTMCHYGSIVTIAGLPDSNLNTDYHIVDYSFTQPGGFKNYYEWNLTLEED